MQARNISCIRGDAPLSEQKSSGSRRPPFYKIIVLDDDETPFDFAVTALQDIFDMSAQQAIETAQKIHHNGGAVCGLYPKNIADMKMKELARDENGFPLRSFCEPG